MIVYPVKHSPLLRQPEHFIARDELKTLIKKVTHNLVNIHDETGEFLLRLVDTRRRPVRDVSVLSANRR